MTPLITETFAYDGGRQVTAYVPPVAPEAVVFAGDGQLITSWGADLEAAGLPPTMIIGAHRLDDETRRLREYSPGKSTPAFASERFAAHETFFVEDVRRWAQSRFDVALPAERTATDHLARCRARCRARTSSPAHRSRSSSRTPPGGPTRCGMPARTLS
jgi:hypothetical protein